MKQRAFTLIELLVVIAIIGLLSSVVLASLKTARAKSRDTRRLQDLVQIRNALYLYASDHGGNFPSGFNVSSNDAGWQVISGDPLSPSGLGDQLKPYIPKMPVDPQQDSTHYYAYWNPIGWSWGSDIAGIQPCHDVPVLFAFPTEGTITKLECQPGPPMIYVMK